MYIEDIIFNYDNISLLGIIKSLLYTIINDIEYMNDIDADSEYLDLGSNTKIKREDFKSLVSMIDTIKNIERNK